MKTRVVVTRRPGEVVLEECEIRPGDNEVLVKTYMSSICGTDKNYSQGMMPREVLVEQLTGNNEAHHAYPLKMGHEAAGEIDRLGIAVQEVLVIGVDLHVQLIPVVQPRALDGFLVELEAQGFDRSPPPPGRCGRSPPGPGFSRQARSGDNSRSRSPGSAPTPRPSPPGCAPPHGGKVPASARTRTEPPLRCRRWGYWTPRCPAPGPRRRPRYCSPWPARRCSGPRGSA